MKVTISVPGKFHAFYLAFELMKRGYLDTLITSYPKCKVVKYGLEAQSVKSILIKEIVQAAWEKSPAFLRTIYNPTYFINEIFDKRAARRIGNPDIFVGWSFASLHSLKVAKQRGIISILQRGSSHILFQQDILKAEYERFGEKLQFVEQRLVDKELEEYAQADYIEVPSSFAKKTFLDQGVDEKKIIQGFRGVNIREFPKVPKIDKTFRVIYAGNMTLQKGVHYLLQAFSEINLPNSELLLIGLIRDEIKPFFRKYSKEF